MNWYDEYHGMAPEKKAKVREIIMSDNPDKAMREAGDKDIESLAETVRKGTRTRFQGTYKTIAPMKNAFSDVKSQVQKAELISAVEDMHSLSTPERETDKITIVAAVNDGNTSRLKAEQRKMLQDIEADVKARLYKDKKKIDAVKERIHMKENFERYHKEGITAKDMIRRIAIEEVEDVEVEIDRLEDLDPSGESDRIKSFLIRRHLAKLKRKIEEIEDKEEFELEDELEDEIAKRNKRRKRMRRPLLRG
jgi:hypothetical protein